MIADASAFFEGFSKQHVDVGTVSIHARVGGSGPPVLLLHGYPQTHATWHRVAPKLAERFTVVATDLRGYGQSSAPQGDSEHRAYSKSTMAADQVATMQRLGFSSFLVVGHDRGGRVGYRMALEYPDRVAAFASLGVIPTSEMWSRVDKDFGLKAWHWFFLAQPYDLPERLIGADPDHFLGVALTRMAGGLEQLHPQALASYRDSFRRKEGRHAMCEDYRAAASIDTLQDQADRQAGRKLGCPVLVLWSRQRIGADVHETPLEVWRRWALDVQGRPIDAGHLLAEQAPDEVLEELLPFLDRAAQRL